LVAEIPKITEIRNLQQKKQKSCISQKRSKLRKFCKILKMF